MRLYISWWGERYYIGLMDVVGATSHMMTEACGGTSHMMMKVYDAISWMTTEVDGEASYTESIWLVSGNLIVSMVIDMIWGENYCIRWRYMEHSIIRWTKL